MKKITQEELDKYFDDSNKNGTTVDLPGKNLSEISFEWRYLNEANLSKSDLRGSNLRYAYLNKANLSGSDLRHAYLSEAYLSEVNLSGSDLSGSDLFGVIFEECDLTNVTFTDEQRQAATFTDSIGLA